jgi:hypothetical protein
VPDQFEADDLPGPVVDGGTAAGQPDGARRST